jgi:hypothetical protein
MYKLLPAKDGEKLFFRMESEPTERYGAIGYLRADYGTSGREFWKTWFEIQPRLKTHSFQQEFDDVINSLREDGNNPPLASRENLKEFCFLSQGMDFADRGKGYIVRTQAYSYYFRCQPRPGDYDIYCFIYDNTFLLPALAKQPKNNI